MKSIIARMSTYGIICKKLTNIKPKELGTRKKIDIYAGVSMDGYYCSILYLVKKSRVLSKEAKEIMLLHEKLEDYNQSSIKKRYIWVEAPLCSKAKKLLEASGWKFL